MNVFPRVSVMIITYNQAHLIAETIESVLIQNYPNLEIIIADDASVDGTQSIIQDYVRRYPDTIKLICNPQNVGITGNCNIAFSACTGELIATLGGDDIFLPGKLVKQVQQFVDDPSLSLSYHPVEIFQHQTGKILYITNQLQRENPKNVYEIIEKGGIAGACSVMVRRSACPYYGFDTSIPVVSDWMFYIEVAYHGKVEMLNEVLGRYRKHGFGASERMFELLEESLSVLHKIQAKYPHDRRLQRSCKKGAARYIAGEVFRQLTKQPAIAKSLAKRVLAISPFKIRYYFLFMIAYLMDKNRVVRYCGQKLLPSLKYTIKKYLG